MNEKKCQLKDNGNLPHDVPSKENIVSQRTKSDISQPDDSLTKPIRQCGKSLVESSINSENAKVFNHTMG